MDFNPFLALEKIPVGIFILRLEDRETKEFRNVYVNETDSKIVGADLKPFMGMTLRESFPESYNHGLPDKYLEALDTGETVKIGEMQYGDETVEKQTFFLQVKPISEDMVMLTTENISGLRKAREELLIKNKDLENKNQEIKNLTFSVSHDLKSPVNLITGLIQIVRKNTEQLIDETSRKSLALIEESSTRMKLLIEEILEYSLIGKKTKLQKVNSEKILEEVLTDLDADIKAAKAKITHKNMPSITAYKTELRQLFQNLLSNAIKFRSENTSPEISINVSKDENSNWHFVFKDNGIGIAQENHETIFGMFEKLHKREDYAGIGIGLANCQKIVHLHNGKIWVDSALNEGASFHFTIPVLSE